MPLVPIAAFLTGALLTILLPLALLIALGVWYWQVAAREPDTAGGSEAGAPPPASTPAPPASTPAPPAPTPAPAAPSETDRPAPEA